MRSPYFKTNVTSGFTDEALNEIFGSLIVVVAVVVVVVVARLHRSGIGISDIFSAIKKPVAGFSAPTVPTRHVGRKTILFVDKNMECSNSMYFKWAREKEKESEREK